MKKVTILATCQCPLCKYSMEEFETNQCTFNYVMLEIVKDHNLHSPQCTSKTFNIILSKEWERDVMPRLCRDKI